MAFGRRTLRSVLTIGALDVLIVFCWLFYRTSTITHNGAKQRSLLQVLHIQAESVCRPHQHVAFVKVQKAGSSTVQNIMYRFGTSKNLTFVLPKYGNYISYSTFVRDRDVMPLPVFAEKFDMTCNHVKYNRTAFEKFLPEDTSYVGIVRHPLSLLNSYIYYFLEHVVPGEDKLAEFLSDPRYYAAQRNVSLNLLTNYFGLPNSHASNLTHIDAFITKLDNDFDMMMILELFDESLLLMKRMFCWNISDVLYVKKNERENKPSLNNLTVVARNKHRSVANADYLFYKHFYKKMQDKIFKAGADFQRELVFFREARAAVEKFCRRQLWRVDGSLRIAESPWQGEFEVTGEMCRMIMMSELELQDHVGVRQYGRMWSELHRKQFYH